MENTLHIRLLDTFHIEYNGETVDSMDSARLQELLAWLLLNRDTPQPRRQIAFQFWPNSSEKQALTNLRNLLYKLRQKWPDCDQFIHTKGKTIQWNTDAEYWLDVSQFHRLIQLAEEAEFDGNINQQLKLLKQATDLYKGDLFQNCYKNWMENKRGHYKQKYIVALKKIIELCELQRSYQEAIPYAKKLISCDEYDEAGYRRLMHLYMQTGNRPMALKTYQKCKELLWDELNIEPSAKTKELYSQFTNKSLKITDIKKSANSNDWEFVGRRDSWNHLLQKWKDVLSGSTHFVMICGQPGIGKTRLASEFAMYVKRSGYSAMQTRLYPETKNLNYGMAAECLSQILKDRNLESIDEIWRQELVRILPSIRKEKPQLSDPEPIDNKQKKQLFWKALSMVLNVSNESKMLLLDDLHWSDSDSLDWLAYLLHQTADNPLLLIATARPVEGKKNEHLQSFITHLKTESWFSELSLYPFGKNETSKLITSLKGKPVHPEIELNIFNETEGNPLFIVEYMRKEEFSDKINSKNWLELNNYRIKKTTHIPKKVEAIISIRLSHVSNQARELIELSSCIGREFSFEILEMASGLKKSELVGKLDELLKLHIIREKKTNIFDFTHDKLREVAYNELSNQSVRWNHLRIANAMETILVDEQKAYSSQMAFHYENAGEHEKAISYYKMAAQEARKMFSDQDVLYYTRAIELLKKLPPSKQRDREEQDLLMKLGMSLTIYKGYGIENIDSTSQRLKLISERLDDSQSVPVLFTLALAKLVSGNPIQAKRLAADLKTIVNRLDDNKLFVESNYQIALVDFMLGDISESIDYIREGLKYYEHIQAPFQSEYMGLEMGMVLNSALALLLTINGDFIKSDKALCKAFDIADETKHSLSTFHLQYINTMIWQLRENIRETQNNAHQFIKSGSKHMFTYWHHFCEVFFGWSHIRKNNYEEGLKWIQKGIDNLSRESTIWNLGYCYSLYAEAFALQGDFNKAISTIEKAFHHLKTTKEGWYKAKTYHIKGKILAENDPEKAKSAFTKAIDIAHHQDAKLFEKQAINSLEQLN